MEWDFSKFIDKELVEICAEVEKKEKQMQQEKEREQITEELKQGEIVGLSESKEEKQQEVLESVQKLKQEEELKQEVEIYKKEEQEQLQTDDIKQIQSTVEIIKLSMQTEKPKQTQSTSEIIKIFDNELAIEIVKSDKFKEDLIFELKDASRRNRKYIDILKDLLMSETTEKYKRRKDKYLNVMLTLRGKKEVLKYIPPGVYPVVYEEFYLRKKHDDFGHSWEELEGELWIAINRGWKLYAVVIKDLQFGIPFPSVFNVAFLIVRPDNVEFLVVELNDNTEFPIYAKCDKYCRWMPEPVLLRITDVLVKNIEYWKKYKQEQLQTQEPTKEEDKLLKKVLYKRVREGLETVLFTWNKYVRDTYLLPYIWYKTYTTYYYPHCYKGKFRTWSGTYYPPYYLGKYRLINGFVKFFPKAVFLPKQIHIKQPHEVWQIPEGVYPIIRYYRHYQSFKGTGIVFAISPNTEVVFEFNSLTENVFQGPLNKQRPMPLDSLEFVAVWNGNVIYYPSRNFDYEIEITLSSLPEEARLSSSYWKIGDRDEYMFYLPEVLFLYLVGEKVKTQEIYAAQVFVADVILNSHKSYEEWDAWVKSLIDEYNNIKVDNEKITVKELSEFQNNIPSGPWYVKEIKRVYSQTHKYELVIVDIMGDSHWAYKVRTNFELELTEDNVGKVFLTVWPDGTAAFWILETYT
jgi:hypothetical protein